MEFLKNKTTGKYAAHDAVMLDPEEKGQYEKVYDYQVGFLKKINERLGWLLAILVIQMIGGIIAIAMYL